MDNDKRKVERRENDEWIEISFRDLKLGNIFRMFDPPDNTPVKAKGGHTVFMAISDTYLNSEGVLTIDADCTDLT